jgi:hypothetical protein
VPSRFLCVQQCQAREVCAFFVIQNHTLKTGSLKHIAVKQEQLFVERQLREEKERQQQHDDSQVQDVIGHLLDRVLLRTQRLQAEAPAPNASMLEASLEEKEKDRAAEVALEVKTETPYITPAVPSSDALVTQPNSTPVIRSDAAAPEIGNAANASSI